MPMAGTFLNARKSALAIAAAAVIAFSMAAAQAQRGPDKIADVAEAVIDAVVNISTSQTVTAGGASTRRGPGDSPEAAPGPGLPPGPPFEAFVEEFCQNRSGG